MRYYRLFIVMLLLLFSFTLGSVLAQDEATEEVDAEATEIVEEADATPEATEETDNEEESVTGSTYVVQVGDNLFRIALRFGLTTTELAEANNISNPSLIFVGQVLTVPGDDVTGDPVLPEATDAPEPATPEATVVPEATETPDDDSDDTDAPVSGSVYVVQPGDTLFRIAVSNGTTVATLLSLNPSIANANIIFVGQEINLPDGAGGDDSSSSDGDEASVVTDLDIAMSTGVEYFLDDAASTAASQISELGVDWVKITVSWSQIEPEQGSFNFGRLDAAINEFESLDVDIIFTLTDAPNWSRPSATELALQQPTYGPPDDLDSFGTFAGEVASRYAGQVAAYEIWFQPNVRISWMRTNVELRSDGFPDAGLSEVRYIDLLEVAYAAIKAADEDALVLTAGLAPTGINDNYNAISNSVFFEALLEQGAENFSDGFGIHIDGFSNAPDARCCGDAETAPEFDESFQFFFADMLDEYRSILNDNGNSDTPLWITRVGWGTVDNALGDGSELAYVQLNSEDEQADYIEDALAAGDERGDVGAMIVYNLNGCSSTDPTACYYSLIDTAGDQRPAFTAVAEANK